jgi:hypothetical protein
MTESGCCPTPSTSQKESLKSPLAKRRWRSAREAKAMGDEETPFARQETRYASAVINSSPSFFTLSIPRSLALSSVLFCGLLCPHVEAAQNRNKAGHRTAVKRPRSETT